MASFRSPKVFTNIKRPVGAIFPGRCKVISSQAASAVEANARMEIPRRQFPIIILFYLLFSSIRFFFHRSIVSMQKFAHDSFAIISGTNRDIIINENEKLKFTRSKDVIAKLFRRRDIVR